jgi:hypothetical protein
LAVGHARGILRSSYPVGLIMRLCAVAFSIVFMSTVALAEEAPPTPPAPQTPAAQAPPVAPPATAPTPPDAGDEIICKRTGDTGSRLKSRGKRICGKRSEWEDHNSELNRTMNNTIRQTVPPKG